MRGYNSVAEWASKDVANSILVTLFHHRGSIPLSSTKYGCNTHSITEGEGDGMRFNSVNGLRQAKGAATGCR